MSQSLMSQNVAVSLNIITSFRYLYSLGLGISCKGMFWQNKSGAVIRDRPSIVPRA